jgi:hypothetical protein
MTQCQALSRYDNDGELEKPRLCKHRARSGSFCGLHQLRGTVPAVICSEGAWCVWCAGPARRYERSEGTSRVAVSLCDRCLRDLFRAAPMSAKHRKRSKKV